MLTKIFTFFRAIRQAHRETNRRMLKLETLFLTGNVLKGLDGRRYRVVGGELCFAILMDFRGNTHIVDWLTPAGTIRDEVADRFDIIETA